MLRRSKVLRSALASLTWPDGSSRWDTTRHGCFHCGKSSKDLKRNVCPPCRTDEFVPEGAPASSVYAKGYRVCTDHCTTIPLPLHLFNNGNKKCKSCLDKRRMRKLKKRGVEVSPAVTLSASDYGLPAAAGPQLLGAVGGTKRQRRARASDDAEADSSAAFFVSAAASSPARSSRPSRLSALSARKRIAAIGADEHDHDDGEDDDSSAVTSDGTVSDGLSSPSSSASSGGSAVVMPTPINAPSSSVGGSPTAGVATVTGGVGAVASYGSSQPIPKELRLPVSPPAALNVDVTAGAGNALLSTVFDTDFPVWSPVPARQTCGAAAAGRPAPPAPLRQLSSTAASMVAMGSLGTITPLGATGLTPLFDWSGGLVSPSLARLL